MKYYRVWYYYTTDEEGVMHSHVVDDITVMEYINNDPHESGIRIWEILQTTREEYLKQYRGA